jgi:hypothetical protein
MEKYLVCNANANQSVESLLNHPRTQQLSQNKNMVFVWKAPGQPVRMYKGMTKRIRKLFYPTFTVSERKRKRGTSSIDTGNRVHRQIYHMIECTKGKCTCTTRTNPNRLHKFTKQFFAACKRMEITPMASEVCLLCEQGGFCTRLDAVGYRYKGTPQQRSVIISIKTGYSGGLDIAGSVNKLLEPLDSLDNTSRTHAFLQCAMEREILKREYEIEFDDAIVFFLGQGNGSQCECSHVDLSSSLVDKLYASCCA